MSEDFDSLEITVALKIRGAKDLEYFAKALQLVRTLSDFEGFKKERDRLEAEVSALTSTKQALSNRKKAVSN